MPTRSTGGRKPRRPRPARPLRVGIYARVSARDRQDPENQLRPLRAWAKACGFEAVEYVDRASGGRADRPSLAALLDAIRRGEVHGARESQREIARLLGVGKATVARALAGQR